MTETTNLQNIPVRTRVSVIADALRSDILSGKVAPGDRLPSEAELTRTYSVSRTVVREAFAQLRTEGLVEARKGSGVYVLDPAQTQQRPFSNLDTERLSGVIELSELRCAFEFRSVALAAMRRSGAQIEQILRAQEEVARCFDAGESTREADFAFHLAIADASQNKRFSEFLTLIRPGLVPRVELLAGDGPPQTYVPNPDLLNEHNRIIDAIIQGDPEAAESAMKTHLENGLERYRALLSKSYR